MELALLIIVGAGVGAGLGWLLSKLYLEGRKPEQPLKELIKPGVMCLILGIVLSFGLGVLVSRAAGSSIPLQFEIKSILTILLVFVAATAVMAFGTGSYLAGIYRTQVLHETARAAIPIAIAAAICMSLFAAIRVVSDFRAASAQVLVNRENERLQAEQIKLEEARGGATFTERIDREYEVNVETAHEVSIRYVRGTQIMIALWVLAWFGQLYVRLRDEATD